MTPRENGAEMPQKKTLYDLGGQQRSILEIVWGTGGASVREVWDRLSPDRRLAYTSVLSAMQKLERMGWLRHRREARSYVYTAAVPRERATLEAARRFVHRVYRGDAVAMLRQLLTDPGIRAGSRPPLRTLVELRRNAA
jgi:BlaI family penicillinase repressor